ncbi:MAG: ABC transporter substrate-binding protein [Roseburia sp.]|nr:ABC transporter substrate-binding protein [Roseburia sp.]
MKNAKKFLALFLAVVMCLGLLAGCKGNEDVADNSQDPSDNQTDAPENNTPLVASVSGFEGKFSPFFASSADDVDVTDLTQMYLMGSDRVGNPVLNGIEGETRSYNGTDYFYDGIADIVVTENADGTVTYDFTMRDDIVFSDGVPATIDDVIFSLYVLIDPTYDGSSTIYSQPIVGMDEYRGGMDTLAALIAAAGKDNTDFTYWDEATQTTFWNDVMPSVGQAWLQTILNYCIANGYATGEEPIEEQAINWGWELEAGATMETFWNTVEGLIGENYADYNELSDVESADASLWSLMPAEYQKGVQVSDSAPNVAGIEKTGDYTLRITASQLDATMIYQMALLCAPLHYYGDESLYDYDNNQFGFTKGDLSGIKAKTSAPVGAGPYKLTNYSNGVVYMEANENYYKGAPAQKYLNFQEINAADSVSAMIAGTADITAPSFSDSTKKEIKGANSNGELVGDVITTDLIDYRGYGYMGCNPNLVKVGDDPYSEASRNLRKAIMTVVSVYRDEGIDSYYGETASVINYPISNTSWAAPQVTDDGYHVAYSVDVNGNDIYADGATGEAKYDAALQAALGFFEAAGYTVTDGKLTAAPEGAKLTYQVEIGAEGSGNHPTFLVLKNASEKLATIGFTLNVKDWAQASDLFATYQTGVAEFWCAAWQSTADPDMFQLYHSQGSTNYYHILSDELDELIMEGRASTDNAYRKGIYQAAMEIIMDYAVELPVYQRSECTLFSTQRVDLTSVQTDMTPYWTWKAGLDTIKAVVA